MTGLDILGITLLAIGWSRLRKASSTSKPIETQTQAVQVPLRKTTHTERLNMHGGMYGYIKFLYDLFHSPQVQSELQRWDTQRIKSEIIRIAKSVGIDPVVLYGIIKHESRLKPVGIYADNPEKALAANSTAYGVGQIVSKTFDSISPYVDFDHWDMWRPDRGILATAILLKILLQKRGSLEAALQSYAGTWQGGQNLLSYIMGCAGELVA